MFTFYTHKNQKKFNFINWKFLIKSQQNKEEKKLFYKKMGRNYKISNKPIFYTLIILFIVEIATVITRWRKYLLKYDCYNFSLYLQDDQPYNVFDKNMTANSRSALRKISYDFPEYYDSAYLSHIADQSGALFDMCLCCIPILFSLYFVISHNYDKIKCCGCCECCNCCDIFWYFITPIACIISSIMTIKRHIKVVPKEDIDDNILNEYLNNNLDKYYYNRKRWLIICAFTIIIITFIQIILVLILIVIHRRNYEPETKKDFVKPSEIIPTSSNVIDDSKDLS